jgi:polyhydroxyalkanoate synthesis repressor PhaR
MKRLIKKYPNRRLYDTVESRYITLADIRDLVMNGSSVTVIDKQTGKDISRSIFLQVISDQEQQGEPILSEAFLSQVIRAHGAAAPGFLGRHLEKSLTQWLLQQNQMLGQVIQAVGANAEPQEKSDRQNVG